MASPEQIGEWLNEEMKVERPAGDGLTADAELSALVAQLHVERQMGEMEEMEHIMHGYGMWVLSRTLLVTCTREPTEEQVHRALVELIKWNPSLHMSINKPEDESKQWELLKTPDAKPRLVHVMEAKSWNEVAEEQMLIPLEDPSAPQFRCHYLSKVKGPGGSVQKGLCAFVFILNHAIIDGMSSIALLKKFHSILNSIIKGKPYIVIPWTRMFPPLEMYCERAYEELGTEERGKETQEFLESLPKFDIESFMTYKNGFTEACGTESKKNPDIPAKTCVISRELSDEQVQKLRSECRKHSTTIQGAAQVAGAIALASLMPSGGEDTEVTYNLAINLRPHVAKEVPLDYAGLYIALSMMNTMTIGSGTREDVAQFWRLAAESTAKIKDHIKSKRILSSWMSLKGQAQILKKVKLEDVMKEGESRIEILYTTTYGVWDFPTEADDVMKVQGVFSSSSIHRAGPIINQQLVTVNGKMYWSMAYSPRVISRETAKKYADTTLSVLNRATEELQESSN